ncbi:hypothetical protein [Phytoactinopolyspora mesophila]|uniref:hypothetical protein n=1 Tax=Phytoactinopolyspora mesophila TaxID=2650750 RepID=UPI001C9E7530|nr:hypothetical protein [Phytoactinopolyspora mesophila]
MIAIVGHPGMLGPVADAGYDLLCTEAEPEAVSEAGREAETSGRPYVVISSAPDARTRTWLGLQVAKGKHVLIVDAPAELDGLAETDLPGTRVVTLPASIDDIMSVFGAPERGDEAGKRRIGIDGEPERPAHGVWAVPAFSRGVEVTEPPGGQGQSVAAALTTFAGQGSRGAGAPLNRPGRVGHSRRHEDLAPVLFLFAGSGGVTKSSSTTALCQRAATVAGMARVVGVDMNRGQGDLRRYVHVVRRVPSIFDAAHTGDPRSAVIGPRRLNAARDPSLPPVGFGLVAAPRDDQAEPGIVTSRTYLDVIHHARQHADLVVVDTQIIEASDTSGLIDGVMLPVLASGGWGAGVTDTSASGARNLLVRAEQLVARGADPGRMMYFASRALSRSARIVDALRQNLDARRLGTFIGIVPHSEELHGAFDSGRIPHDHELLAPVLDGILYRVTNLDSVNPDRHERGVDRGGFMRRWFGRG